jgi:hypothetical protein
MAPAAGLTGFARTCIAHLKRDQLAEPVVLIIDPTVARPSSRMQKLKKAIRLDGNLWHLQNKLFPLNQIESYQIEPLESWHLPRLVCQPILKGKWSQYFKEEDIEAIRSFNLDFILKFAFGIIRGEILKTARYGVWSYHHDDEEKFRGGPPAFWEITKADPVTGAMLQRLTDRLDGGVVLKKCYVPTDGLSYRRNLERIQHSSTHLARWVCLDIHHGLAGYLDDPPSKTEAPIYRAPNDWQMLEFWGRLLANWIRYKINNQRMEVWNVGLIQAPPSRFLDENYQPQVEWSEYRESEQFVADPFLVPGAGETRILAEELHYFTEMGRIVEIRRGADGKLSALTPVIDAGIHMSYPYVIENDDAIYAIPESSGTGEVRLYRLDAATDKWLYVTNLISGVEAVDATVFEAYGSWWLLHSCASGVGSWSLYVWNAPSLFGPWQPHPGNPVKTDVKSARPAGNPFWQEGHLYRPAQDGRKSYGGAMTINRIDMLSMDAYRETVVRWIEPDAAGPYPDGIHTLSGLGDQCVVDGKKHAWSARLIAARLWTKVTRRRQSRPYAYSCMILTDDPVRSKADAQ